MGTQTILANETVSISELRNNIGRYFTDHAIAVLSNNKPTGYVIGAKAFEAMVNMLLQAQQTESFNGSFRPTSDRLKAITQKGLQILENASEDELKELGKFSE